MVEDMVVEAGMEDRAEEDTVETWEDSEDMVEDTSNKGLEGDTVVEDTVKVMLEDMVKDTGMVDP